jgi:Cytochrome c2
MRRSLTKDLFTVLGAAFTGWLLLQRLGHGRPTRRPLSQAADQIPLSAPPKTRRGPTPAMLVSLSVALVAALGAGYFYNTYTASRERQRQAEFLTGGDVHRGRIDILRYGCAGCHTISGIPRADGLVGPPLTTLSQRVYIAGMLKNTPDNIVRWIVNPREINPQTAMPVTGISQAEARDVAAYLYTLD